MSYIDLKISDQEAGANNVQSAPNVLIKTPQENKAVFDALPDIVRQRFNSLIDELTQGGYLPLQGQEDLIIRINSTNGKMEFSLDAGQTWQASANEGHRILTSDGTVMPQRSDLRFEGANVRTEENQTVVNFQSGAQGIPEGGTTGQILRKNSNESYDADWKDKAADSEKLNGISASDYMRFSSFGDPDDPNSVLKASNATEHIEKKTGAHTPAAVGAMPIGGGAFEGKVTGTDATFSGRLESPALFCSVGGTLVALGADQNLNGAIINAESGLHILDLSGASYRPVYGTTFVPSSSQKYKENIENLTLEKAKKVLDFRAVEYDLKGNKTHTYGFIAEEIENSDCTYVHYKNDEANGLDYMAMIAPIKMLISDLYAQIDELKKKLEAQYDTI